MASAAEPPGTGPAPDRARVGIRLLGRVEADRGGDRLELGGPKQRAVLAALALEAGRVVPLDRLIDDLWPDAPPSRATATVQVFVSNLRRVLEPGRARGEAATVLVTAAPGYLLAVPDAAVDAHAFARTVQQGRAALAADDPDRAVDLLRRADELWHGPALADLQDAPFARLEATRLEELRLAAAEDRVDAELALGRHVGLVAELEQRVARYPLRERPRAQLMLALYRSGRQADALERYRAGRAVLRDELGLDPGGPLRELERAVLRHDPDLGWEPAAPAVPVPPAAGPAPREPGRVLVVDDSGVNRRLLATALTTLGHSVTTAENGRRALELLREDGGRAGGFDVVLLDLVMPVMDGFATLAAIKAEPALDHLLRPAVHAAVGAAERPAGVGAHQLEHLAGGGRQVRGAVGRRGDAVQQPQLRRPVPRPLGHGVEPARQRPHLGDPGDGGAGPGVARGDPGGRGVERPDGAQDGPARHRREHGHAGQ